ncbi:MAG: hypothetical protein ABI210_01110 [Abditibacteriaceae bacterium]
MHYESLQEGVNIPKLGGTLVAEFRFNRSLAHENGRKAGQALPKGTDFRETMKIEREYSGGTKIENYEFRWRVFFLLKVLDRRYNSAETDIWDKQLPELISGFETAYAIIPQLQTANLSGNYLKSIQANNNHKIEIVGTDGALGLRFSISNEQRWLSATLSLKQIDEAIEKLKNAQIRGPQLLETLRKVKELSS